MKSINEIKQAITSIIKDGELQSLTTDIAEVIIDSNLHDGVLKDVPLLNTAIAPFKVVGSIKDALLVKKLMCFIFQFRDIPTQKRKKLLDKIDNSEKYKTRVAEKLLFILDKCQDAERAEIIGKLFLCFLKEQLSYDEFLRASECVDKVFISDLKQFVDERWEGIENSDYVSSLVNAGIARILEVSITEIQLGGGESQVTFIPTEIGAKLRKILSQEPFPVVQSLF